MKQEATIDEQEVTQAILNYAEKHGVRLEGMSAKVDVVAGRAGRGVYATISLEPTGGAGNPGNSAPKGSL